MLLFVICTPYTVGTVYHSPPAGTPSQHRLQRMSAETGDGQREGELPSQSLFRKRTMITLKGYIAVLVLFLLFLSFVFIILHLLFC